jgi:hypothetical protein
MARVVAMAATDRCPGSYRRRGQEGLLDVVDGDTVAITILVKPARMFCRVLPAGG